MIERRHLETDVLVIGAGGAGMSAAIAAADGGANVLLADRSLIGRGGATVMAMMTVAVAVAEETPDEWQFHYRDTLASGRGLCNPKLARLLCEEGPDCIRQMDGWGVGWARRDGHIAQAHAPGHDRPRCVYVDFLNTGPAVSKTLRTALHKRDRVRRVGDLMVIDVVQSGSDPARSAAVAGPGKVTGAVALDLTTGRAVTIAAKTTIIATGGLTRLYARNSASGNMGGDGYALGLRAGARLIDMEFVQFFPIGHLAPRMIGMDPIMWDPFRYKLGGRLLNGNMEEFTSRYGTPEDQGKYVVTRDNATYAILQEVAAGRGTPHGGAYLSFMHIPIEELKAAFGPVIDKLTANGIDLTKMPVEVAPIAHYHMGGIAVDETMATGVPQLLASGEAVGGANGANRLSGNAITEALVFGRQAGRTALGLLGSSAAFDPRDAASALSIVEATGPSAREVNTAAMIAELQTIMWDDVGPFRTQEGLSRAIERISALDAKLGDTPVGSPGAYDMARLDWFDLRNMLLVARVVTEAASKRTESRGAHQRYDYPGLLDEWTRNQIVTLQGGAPVIARGPLIEAAEAAE